MSDVTTPDDGGPEDHSFAHVTTGTGFADGQPGMSLRDYIAVQALSAALIACSANVAQPHSRWADDAYRHADAMLAERAKRRGA